MIKRLDLHDLAEMQINIWQKLNEIIDVVNDMTKVNDFNEAHDSIVNAARKAAKTGDRIDLGNYLRLRREERGL